MTLRPPPHEATRRAARAMARAAGVAAHAVRRIRKAHDRAPHRWRGFKLPTDPAFAGQLHAVVEFGLAPPASAVLASVDEKSRIRPLDRTRPGRPPRTGRDHDHRPHGTTTLFAALHVLTGEDLDDHAAREHEKVRPSLPRHPRRTLYFTPAPSFPLKAAEGFSAGLSRRRLSRGVFCSVAERRAAIDRFIAEDDEVEAVHPARRSRCRDRQPQPRVPGTVAAPAARDALTSRGWLPSSARTGMPATPTTASAFGTTPSTHG